MAPTAPGGTVWVPRPTWGTLDTSQFIIQLGGATLCAVYAFGFTYVVFRVVNAIRSMRVSEAVELEGLDVPEFGMLAYPEEEGIPA